MKKRGICIAAVMVLALCLGGCKGGTDVSGNGKPPVSEGVSEKEDGREALGKGNLPDREAGLEEKDGKEEGPVAQGDTGNIFADCAVSGDVIESSEKGCIINTVQTEGDKTAFVVIDEDESKENHTPIVYREGCVFQFAEIDPKTGETVYTVTDRASVGLGKGIAVFGDYGEDGILQADKVYIYSFV